MEIIFKYFSGFTELQIRQFAALEHLYKEWNSKINIISRKDIDSLYEKHVLHSLSIAAVFEFEPATKIIDIGTGGGFPGIPLAIFFPEVKFHLVDSTAKKIKVADAIAQTIGLKNVSTQHIRVEDIKNTRLPARAGTDGNNSVGQGKFDFAVSRAVAPLKDLWQWSKPLLKSSQFRVHSSETAATPDSELPALRPGLICLKGGDLAAEMQESGTRPRLIEIADIFLEPFFKKKFLLYVSR